MFLFGSAAHNDIAEDNQLKYEIIDFGLYRPVEINGIDNTGNLIGTDNSNQTFYTLAQHTDVVPKIPHT